MGRGAKETSKLGGIFEFNEVFEGMLKALSKGSPSETGSDDVAQRMRLRKDSKRYCR